MILLNGVVLRLRTFSGATRLVGQAATSGRLSYSNALQEHVGHWKWCQLLPIQQTSRCCASSSVVSVITSTRLISGAVKRNASSDDLHADTISCLKPCPEEQPA